MLASYTTTSSPVLDLDMCTLHSCSHSMLYVAKVFILEHSLRHADLILQAVHVAGSSLSDN